MQNHGPVELVGNREGALVLALDHLDTRLPLTLFNSLGDIKPDITTAGDDNTMRFRLLMPEQ